MKKITLLLAVLIGLSVRSQAGVTIDVVQVGGDVVFTTSGSLDLTGAAFASSGGSYGLGFISGAPNWYIGQGSGSSWKSYALTSFASSFGTSTTYYSSPTSSVGDDFFIWGFGGSDPRQVGVDASYVSGASISAVMTFGGATIAGLSLTDGVYNYTLPNDTIVLRIGSGVSVPDSGMTLAMLGLTLAGLVTARRRMS